MRNSEKSEIRKKVIEIARDWRKKDEAYDKMREEGYENFCIAANGGCIQFSVNGFPVYEERIKEIFIKIGVI